MAVAISNINEGSMLPTVTETFREKRYDKSMDEEMNIVTNENQWIEKDKVLKPKINCTWEQMEQKVSWHRGTK